MDNNVIIAIIAATPPTLIALTALYQQFRNHKSNVKVLTQTAVAVENVNANVGVIERKVDQVHSDTNANYNRQQDEITELSDQINVLKEQLAKFEGFD